MSEEARADGFEPGEISVRCDELVHAVLETYGDHLRIEGEIATNLGGLADPPEEAGEILAGQQQTNRRTREESVDEIERDSDVARWREHTQVRRNSNEFGDAEDR